MERVKMVVAGREAMVDSKFVTLIARKESLVSETLALQKRIKESTDPEVQRILRDMAGSKASQIIGINRRLYPGVVQFS